MVSQILSLFKIQYQKLWKSYKFDSNTTINSNNKENILTCNANEDMSETVVKKPFSSFFVLFSSHNEMFPTLKSPKIFSAWIFRLGLKIVKSIDTFIKWFYFIKTKPRLSSNT